MRRDSIFEAVATGIPSIFSYIVLAYETPSSLIYGTYTLQSSEGVQRTFSLAISDALYKISCSFTAGYLDDITLSDKVQNLTGEIKKFQKEALKIGLDVNRAKSEIIGLTDESRSDWSSSGMHYLEPSMAATILVGLPFYNYGFLPILNSHSAFLSSMSKTELYKIVLIQNCCMRSLIETVFRSQSGCICKTNLA